ARTTETITKCITYTIGRRIKTYRGRGHGRCVSVAMLDNNSARISQLRASHTPDTYITSYKRTQGVITRSITLPNEHTIEHITPFRTNARRVQTGVIRQYIEQRIHNDNRTPSRTHLNPFTSY